MRRRAALYIALALCVPLPAFALSGDRPPPAALSVSVGLDRCALVDSQILCKLDLAFDAVDGATSYRAAVTRPDGSVLDLGEVGAGSASLWVPYGGNGTYSVEVSAYGEHDDAEGEPELIDRQRGKVDETGSSRSPQGAEPGASEPEVDEPAANEDGAEAEPDAGGDEGGEPPAPACAGDGTDAGAAAESQADQDDGAGEPAGEEPGDEREDEGVDADPSALSACPE